MTSIYQQALGRDFGRLHPKMQERFGLCSEDGMANIGTGTMDQVVRGSTFTIPFLSLGATRNLLFPDQGRGIPFTVANYAYRDPFGRETVTWHRTFNFGGRRRVFAAAMVYSPRRRTIVDYLGSYHHVAADLGCWVDDEGGMNFSSGEFRFFEGPIRCRIPRWSTGLARAREWWDDDLGMYRITVRITNPVLGHILGYHGTFANRKVPVHCPTDIPREVLPRRPTPGPERFPSLQRLSRLDRGLVGSRRIAG